MKRLRKSNSGQAVVEYIILFAFMGLIGLKMAEALSETFGKSMGLLTVVLSEKLKSGVCKSECYFNGYKNLGDE